MTNKTIKFVTKRDGTKENYDPSKILRWELWAAKGIEDKVDWQAGVMKVQKDLYDGINTDQINDLLIKHFISIPSSNCDLVAGRLLSAQNRKKIYDGKIPTVKEQIENMVSVGLMRPMSYTDEEYQEIESFIDHDRDFDLKASQVKQINGKYSLSNRSKGIKYETPQFVAMRMSMALAELEPNRVSMVKRFYNMFSLDKGSAPTPNQTNLGTFQNGYFSCVLYTVADDSDSLAIGDHIAYKMTLKSAGIGGHLNVRSIGDPVKNGAIVHKGKLYYYNAVAGAVHANRQGARGGACTQFFSVYDPEVMTIIHLQNPRTPVDQQNRDLDFAIQYNDFFISKFIHDEEVFLFNVHTAPDLQEAFFESDSRRFAEIYAKYEADPDFKKTYHKARDLMIAALIQSHEVSTLYSANMTEINRHTPFKEPIHSSNLCLEITQPTKPYMNMMDLYTEEHNDRKGEISMCALGAIIPSNINSDDEYEEVCYLQLKMIDKCMELNDYAFPHLKTTVVSRRNAGVGVVGIAHLMAKNKLKYNSQEGYKFMHWLAERHSYFLIKASLRIAKERGVAPWIHKTKWPEGWTPLSTYNRNVDTIADFELRYDWETLSKEIVEFGGIGHSVLVAHMPTESSSKRSGMPNNFYPIRAKRLIKTDGSNSIEFLAPDIDELEDHYQLAFDLTVEEQYKFYAIWQKFADQAISLDIWSDRVKDKQLPASRLIDEFMWASVYGAKTRYYTTSKTTQGKTTASTMNEGGFMDRLKSNATQTVVQSSSDDEDERGCAGGFCSV